MGSQMSWYQINGAQLKRKKKEADDIKIELEKMEGAPIGAMFGRAS